MAETLHQIRFPGESEAYRAARNELLEAELTLRDRLEAVAALRRKLPRGGSLGTDYVFDEAAPDGSVRQTRLSELFGTGRDSLILYSFMYGPRMDRPCPMCTSFIDGMDAYAPHLTQRVALAVVAKSPVGRLHTWAGERGWRHVRLLSSERNTYNADYAAESPDGSQLPACNVFTRTDAGIFHFWAAEALYVPTTGHPRHVDLLWPIWSYFDLTPEGRGGWMPQLSYR